VLAIVAIAVIQERRTERALDALRELSSPHARVLRDGEWTEIDARQLVPADIIQLAEGDRVPADALLRSGTPLAVDESLLTGESVSVMRVPDLHATTLGKPGDPGSAVFAGTLVGAGHAEAEVIATGRLTEVGRIGTALGEIELARAPLHREIARVVRCVAVAAGASCLVLAAIYVASGRGWLDAMLAAITLAMALLPEELPLVLTVFLTLGAWRIARHRVLARRAAAIETLGAVTVLAVDKTGTLTQNRMAIGRIEVPSLAHDVRPDAAALPEALHEVVEYGLLASPRQSTDPMDRAFATLAGRALANTEHVHPGWRWVREYPLSPRLLAVTHVWRDDDDARTVIATKGAPEAIIDLCHLDEEGARGWRERVEAMARAGLRVLGVARATLTAGAIPANPHDYAFELVGMVGLADPLREDTATTIATCTAAGVRVIMITGDHPTTATAIARAAGLDAIEVLTGADVEKRDEHELAAVLARVSVIARAAPAHKLRIIQALRARGEIVGMTGVFSLSDPRALVASLLVGALPVLLVGVAMGISTGRRSRRSRVRARAS
jgi:Ca2+-transporting ATPase